MTVKTFDFDKLNKNRDRITTAARIDLKTIDNLLSTIGFLETIEFNTLSQDFKSFIEECRHHIRHLIATSYFQENKNFKSSYHSAHQQSRGRQSLDEPEEGEDTFGFWLESDVNDDDFQWFPLWEKLLFNTKRELNRLGVKVYGHLNRMGCDPCEI